MNRYESNLCCQSVFKHDQGFKVWRVWNNRHEQCAQETSHRKNRAAKEGQTQTGSLPDSPSLHTLKLFQTSSPGVGKGFDGGFLAAPSEAPYAICHRALRNSGSH